MPVLVSLICAEFKDHGVDLTHEKTWCDDYHNHALWWVHDQHRHYPLRFYGDGMVTFASLMRFDLADPLFIDHCVRAIKEKLATDREFDKH